MASNNATQNKAGAGSAQNELNYALIPIDERIAQHFDMSLFLNEGDYQNAEFEIDPEVQTYVNGNAPLAIRLAINKAYKLGLIDVADIARMRFCAISIAINRELQAPKQNGKNRMFFANVAFFTIISNVPYFIGYVDPTSAYHYIGMKWFEARDRHIMSTTDCFAIGMEGTSGVSIDSFYEDQYLSATAYMAGGLLANGKGVVSGHARPTKRMAEQAKVFFEQCCEESYDRTLAIKRVEALLAEPTGFISPTPLEVSDASPAPVKQNGAPKTRGSFLASLMKE